MKALVAVLVLLLGLAVVADRVAVAVAEDSVAQELAGRGGLPGRPAVDIAGFPFLTQALAGRYDDVRISLSAGSLGQPEGTRADVSLRGVQVPLPGVLAGSVQRIPVERIEGTATLSYPLLAAQLGPDTTLRREGDQLRITGTVELLGRQVPLTAAGRVTVEGDEEGDEVVVDVGTAEGAGVELPRFLVEQAGALLDLRYPVPVLPWGLRLTGVAPGADGIRLRVAAENTVVEAVE